MINSLEFRGDYDEGLLFYMFWLFFLIDLVGLMTKLMKDFLTVIWIPSEGHCDLRYVGLYQQF